MKKVTFLLLFAGTLMFTSCNEDAAQIAIDQQIDIEEYLTTNGLIDDAVKTDEGIWWVVTTAGTGVENPTLSSEVTVHYEGRLLDGTKFDSSYDRGTPSTFPLTGVIKGWQIGIPKFKKGDIGKLVIPSAYAYGSSGQNSIPGNSVLAFDIELIDFD